MTVPLKALTFVCSLSISPQLSWSDKLAQDITAGLQKYSLENTVPEMTTKTTATLAKNVVRMVWLRREQKYPT